LTRSRAGALGALALLVSLLAANAPPALADEGTATWYGQPYHGRRMANGQVYDMYDPTTTACNIYPMGTWLRVTNPANGKSVVVQVRDRGAFRHALDLSYAAFGQIADPKQMKITVQYQVVDGPNAAHAPATPSPAETPPATVEQDVPAPRVADATPAEIPASRQYEVQPGETLASIARRYDLDPAALASWNQIDDPNLVHAGQVLSLAAPEPPPAAPAPLSAAEAAPSAGVYVVQQGDVLWQVAERYGLTTGALLEANGLSPDDALLPGQELRIPGGAAASSAPAAPAATAEATSEHWYTVQEGDTLAGIAEQVGISLDEILTLNGLDDPSLIHPGQSLRIR
jgi:LysM repeat protein